MENKTEIKRLLESHTHLFINKLNAGLVDELIRDFLLWEKAVESDEMWQTPRPERLIRFILFTVGEEVQNVAALKARYTEFYKRYAGAATNEEQKEHILDFAGDLGATEKALKKDAKAFSRWFGADAVSDRFRKQVASKEMKISFCLDRLSTVAIDFMPVILNGPDYQKLIHRLSIERNIMQLLDYDGDNRVRIAAFKSLACVLKLIPSEFRKESIRESTLKYVFQAALDPRQHIWIQCEALQLLEKISLSSLKTALEKRLSNPGDGDDFFVRSRAVGILADNLGQMPELRDLLAIIARDPSAYVRKTMVRALEAIDNVSLCHWMSVLAMEDPSPQVRASVLLNIIHLLDRSDLMPFLSDLLIQSLVSETDPFTLRVGLKVAADGTRKLIDTDQEDLAGIWFGKLRQTVGNLHSQAENLSVRRWAAQAHEQMWIAVAPDARRLREHLAPFISSIKPGKKKRLPGNLLTTHDPDFVCRVLSVMNQEDFPLEIKTGLFGSYLIKNHCFDFRFWRMIHELRHPAPDKRQAFPHTIGRIFSGHLHIPSSIMSELTSTKVPGEPLFMPEENGWRPYLPLMDEITSLIDKSIFGKKSIRIYTHEGITRVDSPDAFVRRISTKFRVMFGFTRLARMRNREEAHQQPANIYVRELRRLGFRVSFNEYEDRRYGLTPDPAVKRFFHERDR